MKAKDIRQGKTVYILLTDGNDMQSYHVLRHFIKGKAERWAIKGFIERGYASIAFSSRRKAISKAKMLNDMLRRHG